MGKNKISVTILGQEHFLLSTDNPEYVKNVAKLVDDRMNVILKSNSSLTTAKIGVLTALNLADDLVKARNKIEELTKKGLIKSGVDFTETKLQVLHMTKQIGKTEGLYSNILNELENLKKKRANQEKTLRNLTKKLEQMCGSMTEGDIDLQSATDKIVILEEKLLLRENEIAEYVKVFDEIEKEKLFESKKEYEDLNNDIIFEGENF